MAATFAPTEGEAPDPALLQTFVASAMVPPLRHHAQDLPYLVEATIQASGRPRALSPLALRALANHERPGNLSELRSVLDRAVFLRPVGVIDVQDLPGALSAPPSRRLNPMESAERDAIVAALLSAEGNRVRAATELGISRATLYRKIGQYGIAV